MSFRLPLFSGNVTNKFDSTNKLHLGDFYFDPTAAAYGLSAGSTATLVMMLATTNATNAVYGDLYQVTGTGSPQIIATLAATTALTQTKVTVDVSAAFKNSSAPGVFAARIYLNALDGVTVGICTGAWVDVTP